METTEEDKMLNCLKLNKLDCQIYIRACTSGVPLDSAVLFDFEMIEC